MDSLTVNPFVSKAQRRFLYARHPKIAKRWAKHTPKGKRLPERKRRRKRKRVTANQAPVANATPTQIDPSRTSTLRRAFASDLARRFENIKKRMIQLVVAEDAFGFVPDQAEIVKGQIVQTVKDLTETYWQDLTEALLYDATLRIEVDRLVQEYKKELTANDLRVVVNEVAVGEACKIGAASPAKVGLLKRIGGKLDALANKVPGIRHVKDGVKATMAKVHGLLEARYGKKAATAIMTSGGLGGYGVAGLSFALTGVPGIPVVNDLVSIAAHTAVAEGVLQLGRLKAVLRRVVTGNELVANACGQWRALSDPKKLEAFRAWLDSQVTAELLHKAQQDAMARYVQQGFERGAGRAFYDARGAKREFSPFEQPGTYTGSKEEFLRSAFGQPIAKEKIELLTSRVFTDLKGVTDAMATQMTRTLADGLVTGKGPRDIALDLAKNVDGIGINRAKMIARTEVIRAHADGQLVALQQLGVEEVGVMVEWATAGDPCPQCSLMSGKVLKISEAQGQIPLHPNCRCTWIPANVGEKRKAQIDKEGSDNDPNLVQLKDLSDSYKTASYDSLSKGVDQVLGGLPAKDTVRVAKEFGVTAKTKTEALEKVKAALEARKASHERTDFRPTIPTTTPLPVGSAPTPGTTEKVVISPPTKIGNTPATPVPSGNPYQGLTGAPSSKLQQLGEKVKQISYEDLGATVKSIVGDLPAKDAKELAEALGVTAKTKEEAVEKIYKSLEARKAAIDRTDFRTVNESLTEDPMTILGRYFISREILRISGSVRDGGLT